MHNINIKKKVFEDPAYFVAFGFGSGLSSFAPGTFGTLAAIPMYLLLVTQNPVVYLILTLLILIYGTYISENISKELGVHDHSGIVIDEFVGYFLTMFLAPVSWLWIIIGFLLFRLFDIWKPYPISYLDKKITGGFGIMLDDILAAIPAWIILQILIWVFS